MGALGDLCLLGVGFRVDLMCSCILDQPIVVNIEGAYTWVTSPKP